MVDVPNEEANLNFRQAVSGSGVNPSAIDKTFGKDALVDWAGLQQAGVNVKDLKQAMGALPEQIDAELDERTLPTDQRNNNIINSSDLDFNNNRLNVTVNAGDSSKQLSVDFDLSSAYKNLVKGADPSPLFINKEGTKSLTAASITRSENGEMPEDYTVGQFGEDYIIPLVARFLNAGELRGKSTDVEGLNDFYGSNTTSLEAREAVDTIALQMMYDTITSDKRLYTWLKRNDQEGLNYLANLITEKHYDASLGEEDSLRHPIIAGRDDYGKTYYVGKEYERLRRTPTVGGKDKSFWATVISDRAIPKAISQIAVVEPDTFFTQRSGTVPQEIRPYEQRDINNVISYNQNVATWNRSVNLALTESAAKGAEFAGAAVSSAYRGQTLTKSLEDFWQPIFGIEPKDVAKVANFIVKLGPGDSEKGFAGYQLFPDEVVNKENLKFSEVTGELGVTIQDRIMYFLAETSFGRASGFGADADLETLREAGFSGADAVRPGTRFVVNEATGEITSEGIDFQLTDLPGVFASIGILATGTQKARKAFGMYGTRAANMSGRRGMSDEEIMKQAFSRNNPIQGFESGAEISVPVNRSFYTKIIDVAGTKARQQSTLNNVQLQGAMYGGFFSSEGMREYITQEDGTLSIVGVELSPMAGFALQTVAGIVGGFSAFPVLKGGLDTIADTTGATNLASLLFSGEDIDGIVRTVAREQGISYARADEYVKQMQRGYQALQFEDPDTFSYLIAGQKEAVKAVQKIGTALEKIYPDPKNPVRVAIMGAIEQGINAPITLNSMKGAATAEKHARRRRRNSMFSSKQTEEAVEKDINQATILREKTNLENSLIETLAIVEKHFTQLKKDSPDVAEQVRKSIQAVYKYTAKESNYPMDKDGKSPVLDAFIAAVDIRKTLENSSNPLQAEATAIKNLREVYSNLNEQERNIFVSSLLDNEKLFQGKSADGQLRPYVENLWENAIPEVRKIITSQRNEVEVFRQSTFDGTPIATANMDTAGRPLPREVSPDASGRAQYDVLQNVYDALNRLVTEKYEIAFAAGGNRKLSVRDIVDSVDAIKASAPNYGLKAIDGVNAVDSALQRASAEYKRLRKITDGDLEDDGGILGVSDFTLKELHSIASSIEKQAYRIIDSDPAKSAVMRDVAAIFRKPLKEEALSNKKFGKALNNAKNLFQAVIADPFKNTGLRKKIRDAKTENIILQLFKGPDARRNYDAVMEELGKTKDKNGVVIGPALQANLEKTVKNALFKDFFDGNPNMSSTDRFNRLRELERGVGKSALKNNDAYRPEIEGGFLDLLLGKGKDTEFAQRNNMTLVLGSRGEIKYDESMRLHGNTADINNTSLLKSLIISDDNSAKEVKSRVSSALEGIIPVLLDETRDIPDTGMASFLKGIGQKADVDLADALAKKIVDDAKLNPTDASASAIERFDQTVDAVRTVSGKTDADAFEQNLKDFIGRRLVSQLKVKKAEGVDELVDGVDDIKKDFSTLKAFYKKTFGEEHADAMESFLYIKYMSEQDGTILINSTGALGEMSPTMILSRAWGVARKVVSPRYVVSEFIIRRIISRNQATMDEFMSDPRISTAFTKLLLTQEPVDFRQRRYIKSMFTSILMTDESAESKEEITKYIDDFYKQLVNDNEDPELAVISLMLASLNKPFMQSLEEDARKNTDEIIGVREELTETYLTTPRRESLQIDIRTPRGNVQ